MNDYKELCETLRLANSWQFAPKFVNAMLDAADAIEQLVRERDTAVEDIGWNCLKCKHYDEASPNYGYTEECKNCGTYPWFDDEAESKWEWRGAQEVTHEET